MIRLFTDSDCDMTPAVAAEYGYTIISMPYIIDGKTYYPYREESTEAFDFHSYYDLLRAGKLPGTSALTEVDYMDYFRPEFEAGNDILYVHLSEKMTSSLEHMKRAVEQLQKEFPERKFHTINTFGISIIAYVIARTVGDMVKAGKDIDEILCWAEKEVQHFGCWFMVDDLKFFRRSGRVNGLQAAMGGLVGLRPIIYFSPEGTMDSIGTVKGRVNAIERVVKYVQAYGDDIKNHRIVIGHTDMPETVEIVLGMLKEAFGDDLDIEIIDINPTVGAHCGPNAMGITCHCKERGKQLN